MKSHSARSGKLDAVSLFSALSNAVGSPTVQEQQLPGPPETPKQEAKTSLAAAMPASLRRDWEAALRRRLEVERVLEQGEGRPNTPQIEAARRDDVASSEALLAAERLVLRFFAIAPALAGAPPTSVARRYI